ncbi:hypothetical protein QNN00_19130 [Bacillus velezensis]|nr:hypothetical protein [Bacillus velezensis]
MLLAEQKVFLTLPENPWKNVVSSGKVVTVVGGGKSLPGSFKWEW